MVVFRIIKNLIKLALRLLWLPILMLSRSVFLMILAAIAVFFYIRYENAQQPAQLAPGGVAVAPTIQAQPAGTAAGTGSGKKRSREKTAPTVVIEPVSRHEDGDSAFATDLYSQMDTTQRAYYSQFYYLAMNQTADGQTQGWANGNTYGSFTPTRTFTNSSGSTCRHFTEILKVHSTEQHLTGIACVKADGTWCKLRANATPACGLGTHPGLWDSITNLF